LSVAATAQLVRDWFAIAEVVPGVVRIGEPLHDEDVASYLVLGTERALLIDTGMGVGDIRAVVEEVTALPVAVVNSHSHWDHIGGNWRFADLAIHRAEADRLPAGVPAERMRRAFADEHLRGPLPAGVDRDALAIPPSRATTILAGGEAFELGGRRLEVLHTPGHSPGGIVLLDRAGGWLFSTDVAYPGPLYAHIADADLDDYRRSLRFLASLAPTLMVVFPSHNASAMEAALLPAMADALDAIAGGRAADEVGDGVARHRFDGFSVLVRAVEDRRA
jgi:glyoxylase-like metal-dependent hydrolase (beta-lactamase superfamily II)